MQILFLALMFILGSALGSFLCCQARRLRIKETGNKSITDSDAKKSRKVKSIKHSKKTKNSPSRSVCLHCGYRLAWYDNIPIVSWLFLRGKCRKCHKKIGALEILSELGVGLAFLLISLHFLTNIIGNSLLGVFPNISPMGWAVFIATLIFTLSLSFLAIYDGMCGELPVFGLIISGICTTIVATLQVGNSFLDADSSINATTNFTVPILLPIASAIIFGGIYLVLYIVSKGKWVGDGDWILASIIGLALGHPWLAIFALFISNLIACLVMYPFIKNKKNHQIYFGPFLVIGYVIVYAFSNFILDII